MDVPLLLSSADFPKRQEPLLKSSGTQRDSPSTHRASVDGALVRKMFFDALEGFAFDLADAFTGEAYALADFFEGHGLIAA